MEDPLVVLEFISEHSDSDTKTYEAALRVLGKLARGSNYQQIVGDGRYHALLATLATRLDDCDARMLSMIADASARFLTSTPELSDFAQRLAEVVVRREDAFNPRSLSSVALALSMRGCRDVQTVEFVRTEAMKLISDFEPSHCAMLLEAFRRWGVFDRALVDLTVERLSDEVDRFSSKDVVDVLGVASRLGLARGFLLRRLCTLAFENLTQFTPRELVRMSYSLAKLRFLAHGMVQDIVDVLTPEVGRLGVSQNSELLYALAMADARTQLDLARTLVTQYAAAPGKVKTLTSMADFSWSICALELVDEFKPELKAALEQVFDRSPPQNRVPLMKLFDVIIALETEHGGLDLNIPREWKAACDDADRFEMDRLESARLHGEIVMRFDNLRGTANGLKWQLRMQQNQIAGPYRVDMMDEDTRVCLDVETISWPTSRRLKHRILETQGFKPVRIQYWDWRRARTEEDQNTFLEREVTRAMEAKP